MIPRSVFVSVASGVLLAASGCSGGDSGPNGVPVISFHYVSTGEFTYEGETETQREEGYFMGDTARVAYEPGEPYDEIIVIGQDAWARDSSGWFRQDRDFLATIALAFGKNFAEMTDAPTTEGLEDAGPGPRVDGEPTRRYRITATDESGFSPRGLGQLQRSSRECAQVFAFFDDYFESLSEGAFRGSTLLGAETQRVYEIQFEAEFEYSGEEVKTNGRVTMDRYDEAFTINPPAGADDVPERPTPDLPDFPCF